LTSTTPIREDSKLRLGRLGADILGRAGGEAIASDWAAGFLDAVALRVEAWRPSIEDDHAGRLIMMPLLLLSGDIEPEEGFDEDKFLAEAPDMIPTCIIAIHAFWRDRDRQQRAGRATRRRRESKRRR
jgi:uncharacterized protein